MGHDLENLKCYDLELLTSKANTHSVALPILVSDFCPLRWQPPLPSTGYQLGV
jgi:hypothetical protein